jgi:Amt family ammonium transporter
VVTTFVSTVAYLGFGLALQFGGVGLSPTAPAGLTGLDIAWPPFAAGATRWSFTGLEGFFASAQGQAGSLSLVETLALHRLPMAIVAGLIPAVALGDRAPRAAQIGAGLISTAIVFPLAGAWLWGGGWLGMLGLNLNLGHGAIDAAGSGVVFLAAGGVALVALRYFGRAEALGDEATLPVVHQPLLALLGMVLFAIGWSAWTISDPLLSAYTGIDFTGSAAIGLIAAVSAACVAGLYIGLVTGRVHLLMMARSWLAGWIAAGAAAWFIPPGGAIVIGAVAGIASIIGQYVIEYKWSLCDRAGAWATCGLAGAWGLIAAGIFADGAFGAGWNGVDVAHGVRGALASDVGQFSAQLAALAAIGVFAVCVATLLLFPLSILTRRSSAVPPPDDHDLTDDSRVVGDPLV